MSRTAFGILGKRRCDDFPFHPGDSPLASEASLSGTHTPEVAMSTASNLTYLCTRGVLQIKLAK